MKIYLLSIVLVLVSFISKAQDTIQPYFENSGEIINGGNDLYVRGDYENAILEYDRIHPQDTNYHLARFEIAQTWFAKGDFAKAIAISEQNIKDGYNQPEQFQLIAECYLEQKQYEKAHSVYDRALKLYPKNNSLLVNEAVLLDAEKKTKQAVEALQEVIFMNPGNPAAHARLGKIAARQGLYAQAILCYATSLMLDTGSAETLNNLTTIDLISEFGWKEANTVPATIPAELKNLDDLIVSKAALGNRYQTPSKFEYPFIKQFYAVLERTKQGKQQGEGFWATYYYPFFKDIARSANFSDLSLILLSKMNDEKVKREVYALHKQIDSLRTRLTAHWLEMHDSPVMADSKGNQHRYKLEIDTATLTLKNLSELDSLGNPIYQTEFFSTGSIIEKGALIEGTRNGLWSAYYPGGEKMAEYSYKNGLREGPFRSWYASGVISEEGQMLNNERSGLVIKYYPSGIIETEGNYRSNQPHGIGAHFRPDGSKDKEFVMSDGRPNGSIKEYFPDGQLAKESSYTFGDRARIWKTFYPDGELMEEETFSQDLADGATLQYYHDGQLKMEGVSREGYADGIWKYYYPGGKLQAVRNFKDGYAEGEEKGYLENGKTYKNFLYSEGNLTDVEFLDSTGELLFHVALLKVSPLLVKEYNQYGVLVAQGSRFQSNKIDEWKLFDNYGALAGSTNYVDGKEDGMLIAYYPNGQLKSSVNRIKGSKQGLYTEKHPNFRNAVLGHYVNDSKWQEWLYFNANGKPSARLWYQDDKLIGKQEYYDCTGNVAYREYFDETGMFYAKVLLDSNGTILDSAALKNGSGRMQLKGYAGKISIDATYKGGVIDGVYRRFYANGKVAEEGLYVAGAPSNMWSWFHPNGLQAKNGNYLNGLKTGHWEEHNFFGQKVAEENFELDKLNGVATYYYPDGVRELEKTYRNGELNGRVNYYDPAGKLKLVQVYNNGTAVGYALPDAMGQLNKEIGLGHGTVTVSGPEVKPTVSFSLLNGEFEGEVKHSYPNGQEQVRATYKNGFAIGSYQVFSTTGQELESFNYNNGLLHGSFKSFYADGKTREEGTYYLGRKNGVFRYFDNTGKQLGAYQYYDDKVVKVL